ncbi:uncharacterized protein F5891DRAFT_986461 [Suillus fuscotomentosus]|uniref:Uncharacterized protein n=1 Tax=Suillus fuscotomentosus TaxID=1912939 RepID=A0AAD4DTY7_9AGAM|nr:uncharacterized protein F5891DRAFT_986461 [Suillus fuscotomentosus]KAG1891903.1 hypothetical protein F5891DRAFT_986461 [Suillus fuscotomentosus]
MSRDRLRRSHPIVLVKYNFSMGANSTTRVTRLQLFDTGMCIWPLPTSNLEAKASINPLPVVALRSPISSFDSTGEPPRVCIDFDLNQDLNHLGQPRDSELQPSPEFEGSLKVTIERARTSSCSTTQRCLIGVAATRATLRTIFKVIVTVQVPHQAPYRRLNRCNGTQVTGPSKVGPWVGGSGWAHSAEITDTGGWAEACMLEGENGPGGFAKIVTDGPSPHGENGPGGFAKIVTDGPSPHVWQWMGPKCVTGWACMPKGENGPGGFAKIVTDGPSPHLVGMLGNKGNGWAQNVRPGGRAMPEDRPSGLHVILKITTDGPTMDFISEKANWASAYADAVSETVTDGPSPLCLNSEKATDGPSPPWIE